MPIKTNSINPDRFNLGAKLEAAFNGQALKTVEEMRRITPVDTGRLRHSIGYINHSTADNKRFVFGTLEFVNYAESVHNDLRKRHLPPTKAKFIEDPFLADQPKYQRILARAVR